MCHSGSERILFSLLLEPPEIIRDAESVSKLSALFCELFGESVVLGEELSRHILAEGIEKFLLRLELLFPFVALDSEQRTHRLPGDIKVFEVEIFRARNGADLCFGAAAAPLAAIKDPLQDSHVFAETGPQKFSVRIFAKPIHMKDERRITEARANLEPMLKVLAHVVPAERQHRHGIAPNLANCAGCRGGRFRTHGGADVGAVLPIARLKNKRHGVAAASAENDRADRNGFAFLEIRIENGIVAAWRGKTRIRMGGFLS